MNKKFLLSLLSVSLIIILIVSCEKDYTKDPVIPPPPVV